MIFILEDNDERIAGFRTALRRIKSHVERTVPEAIEWLTAHKDEVVLYSLDNDLAVEEYDGDEGEGWQLCEWILANAEKRPLIIHTTNGGAAARMRTAIEAAGWTMVRVIPWNGFAWITEEWIEAVRNAIL